MSSSPAPAVAAPDPGEDGGHGEPKQELPLEAGASSVDGDGSLAGGSEPTGNSDVAMAEDSEELPAVAEVKVEAALVAGDAVVKADVVREGCDVVAASDPLYATESAGMVVEEACRDESVDEVRDVVREEGDVAAASGPMYVIESAGMVRAEGCEDESVREARGLNGGDSGGMLEAKAGALMGNERKPIPAGDIAVAGEVVEAPGSATIELAVAESNNLEENCPDATPVVGNEGRDNGVPCCDEEIQNGVVNFDQCARYCLPPLNKDGFRVSDLVWGKVKSHPWWPGEIFDPSDASELALKHQKKGNRLVAYFGDNSFAWCDESQLKPFVTNYSQMEKQSSSDAFVSSVNYALEELSRRILSGMSCSCLPEELSDNGMSYMVENAGLKDGVTCSEVNRSEILTCFSPESLLRYIRSLALFPGQGGDLLELVIACSQLTSFYRSKGCPELASFQTGSAWAENAMETSPTKNIMVEEPVITEVHPSNDKPKRGRGRPRKHKPEDDLELVGKKATSSLSNDNAYDDFNGLRNKKKRSLDSFEDSETRSSTPTFGSSFKIGECIRRAASQLAGSSSIVKSQNEPAVYKNTAQAENAEFDISSDDAVNELTVEKRAKRRRMHRHHIADPKELLSQLCSVSVEPMNRYNSSAMIISYFSDYRNYVVSTTTEANIVQKSAAKRGRKRRALPSPEMETTDHMQDSYWSGLSLHNHPIHSLKGAAANTRPRRRRRSTQEADMLSAQNLPMLGPKKQIQVIERSIIHVDEKIVNEFKPTALVLSFGRSSALPSETDLIKMFGRYGPLKESETEVQKSTNTVKIVFKKRVDAERAFSAAGKFGMFGPSLRSYRLVNMPFSLSLSEANNPEARPGDHGLDVPGPSESKVSLETVQGDQVDKMDKPEAVNKSSSEQVEIVKQTCKAEPVKESSGEQVETIKETCQPDANCKPLVSQVPTVEKTEQVDAELNGPSDQSEIALSGAATGVIQVVHVIEQARVEPLNEGTKDLTEADTEIEVPEEAKVPSELQDQCFTESEQTVEFQAPKEASAEIPCDAKLEVEALTEESVGQVATEQVKEKSDAVLPAATSGVQRSEEQSETVQSRVVCEESVEQEVTKADPDTAGDLTEASLEEAGSNKPIVESKTDAEVAIKQVCCVEQTVQMGDVTDASGGQIGVGKLTAEDVAAEVMVEGAVESEVDTAVEETVENKAAAETPGGEATEIKTEAEAPGDNMENKPAVEVMVEGAVESEVEAAVEEIVENKAAAGTPGGEATEVKMEAEAPGNMENKPAAEAPNGAIGEGETITGISDTRTEEATSEAVAGETTRSGTTAEAPDVETTTAEKTVEHATVEAPVAIYKNAKTVECATVEAQDEKVTTDQTTVDDAMAEAPDEKATITERTVNDAMAEAPDEIAATAQKTIDDDMVVAPEEITTTAEKTVLDAPDEKTITAETVEDATVEAPDEKTSTAKETADDVTVEALDGMTMMAAKTADPTVKASVDETTRTERIVEDATFEAPDDIAATAQKTVEDATVEGPDEVTTKAALVDTQNEKATTVKRTVDDATVEAQDEKAPTSEKPLEDSTVEAQDEKAPTSEKPLEDSTVEAQDEKASTAEEDAAVEATDAQAFVTEQTI